MEKVSFSKKFMTVKRPVSSLVLIKSDAVEDIFNCREIEVDLSKTPPRKKAVQVTFQDCNESILDI